MIDLREVRGFKDDVNAEFPEVKSQLIGVFRVHGIGGLRALGLQPNVGALVFAERKKPCGIGLRHRLKIAENKRRMAVACDRHFNLGHPVTHIKGSDELTHRREHVADFLRQNQALFHIRDIAGAFFVKAHEHAALFLNVSDRQARSVAVVPEGTVNGRKKRLSLQFSDVPERVG